jgi:hypothetical protein
MFKNILLLCFIFVKNMTRCWAGHVARMGIRGDTQRFRWGDLRERGHLEDQGVDGRVILKWVSKKLDSEAWTGLIWLNIGTGGGHFETRL